MEEYQNQLDEINSMIENLQQYLYKWNNMKVTDYKYTITKFENLIIALQIHKNMVEEQIERLSH